MSYLISIYLKDGTKRQTTYDKLLYIFGLFEESFLGVPMTKGTLNQARYALLKVKSEFPEIVKGEIHDEEGRRVGVFGEMSELLS